VTRAMHAAMIALAALAGCPATPATTTTPAGGGGETDTPAKTGPKLELSMQMTPCMGRCPIYTLWIHDDNSVTYKGEKNVEVGGEQKTTITDAQRAKLLAKIDQIDYWAFDALGAKREPEKCEDVPGGGQKCTGGGTAIGCSDTPHAVFEITVGDKFNKVTNLHCSENALDGLEAVVVEVTGVDKWVKASAQ